MKYKNGEPVDLALLTRLTRLENLELTRLRLLTTTLSASALPYSLTALRMLSCRLACVMPEMEISFSGLSQLSNLRLLSINNTGVHGYQWDGKIDSKQLPVCAALSLLTLRGQLKHLEVRGHEPFVKQIAKLVLYP